MISLMTPIQAQLAIADSVREQRLEQNLTQAGLAKRSGVPLATLRKFEQQGVISLESLVKLLMVLGLLPALVKALEGAHTPFATIDEVIDQGQVQKRKRGRRT